MTFGLSLAVLCVGIAPAPRADAEATLVQNSYSSAPGLPDGRVYEEVSPSNKHGGEAGARAIARDGGKTEYFGESVASADGNSVFYSGQGGMGEVNSGLDSYFVSTRTPSGWMTRSAVPRPPGLEGGEGAAKQVPYVQVPPRWVDPSADLSHVMFNSETPYVLSPYGAQSATIYLAGPNPLAPATWIGGPVGEEATPSVEPYIETMPAGGSPDLSTAYFAYAGTLGLPEDALRVPNASPRSGLVTGEAWGFYEYRDGVLSEAGVLPDGSVNSFGAVPAAIAYQVEGQTRGPVVDLFHNEVSSDGSRAFFVSPDPRSSNPSLAAYACRQKEEEGGAKCTPEEYASSRACKRRETRDQGECTSEVSQLYVRKTAPDGSQSTALVSVDTLLPTIGGLPAPAPHGGVFVYASPDGSHVFFTSPDKLTADAPAGIPPAGGGMYDFDVDTGELSHLAGVSGTILASSEDGSRFIFDDGSTKLWSDGSGEARITPIVNATGDYEGHSTPDGSVFVFESRSQIPGFNDGGGYAQVYRYAATSGQLNCVSCPPDGVTPTGDAVMSNLEAQGVSGASGNDIKNGVVDSRGMSTDGSRVFFDTPDSLVPQDTNQRVIENEFGEIEGVGRDVYEWENGIVYLISSGTSEKDSLYLDSSANGDDVFFATDVGLVPGDTEGGFDVYDARVPHPGDNPPPSAVPCQGDVCQGPPSVPSLLGAPSSATFNGVGNLVEEPQAKPGTKQKQKHKRKPKGKRKKGGGAKKSAARGERDGLGGSRR